jgi:hypothetical protein
MNLPVYYVVRAYGDTTHRGSTHKIEAGPFFEHWRAREWIELNPVFGGDTQSVCSTDIELVESLK